MAERCVLEPSAGGGRVVCPACQTAGQPVDSLTVKALLTESALRRFDPATYRFCPSAGCEVVYFAEHASTFSTFSTFSTGDVRVPVWQKEPPGRRTLCYCFGENEADIAEEADRTGASCAADRVRAHIAAGRCACDVRNPRGACCLGDVSEAVERMRQMRLKGPVRP